MALYMDEATAARYREALDGCSSPVDAAEVAARFARRDIDRHVLELITTAVLSHADNRLGVARPVDRHMWEDGDCREFCRQEMRRELAELVTSRGYVPIALPAEALAYLKMAPPSFGAHVPEDADWDMIEVRLEVQVRTPPIDRAAAVKAGLLTG